MLTLYPADNWNTFGTLQDIQTILQFYYPKTLDAFNALSVDEQNALIVHAGYFIKTCPNITYPDPMVSDFLLAQTSLVAMEITNPTQHVTVDRSITKEKVGDLEVDYDPRYKTEEGMTPPSEFYRIMRPYGCSKGTGFSQSKVK